MPHTYLKCQQFNGSETKILKKIQIYAPNLYFCKIRTHMRAHEHTHTHIHLKKGTNSKWRTANIYVQEHQGTGFEYVVTTVYTHTDF